MLPKDEAERVTDRIEKDVEPGLTRRWHASGTEIDDRLLCDADVINPDVEVQLLRMVRVRPPRWDPLRHSLERELAIAPGSSDDDESPVLVVLVDLHAQDLAIELCEIPRLGTVNDCLLKASDHAPILLRSFREARSR